MLATAAEKNPAPRAASKSSTKIAAYYLRSQMYACVPRQIREDME